MITLKVKEGIMIITPGLLEYRVCKECYKHLYMHIVLIIIV